MKLGQIKLQALSLIYPDWSVEYDDDSVENVIFGLRSNSNFSSYLSASVGAINRAFRLIEKRFLSGKGIKNISSEERENYFGGTVFLLDDDIYKVSSVIINGKEQDYELITEKLMKVKAINSSCEIQVIYFKKINNITHETGSDYDIDLGGIEEFIPYFIKSEILGIDNEEGKKALDYFESMLDEFANDDSGQINTVYSLRRI